MDCDSMVEHLMRFAHLGDPEYARYAAKRYAKTLPWVLADLPARLEVELSAMTGPAESSPQRASSSSPSAPSTRSTDESTGRPVPVASARSGRLPDGRLWDSASRRSRAKSR